MMSLLPWYELAAGLACAGIVVAAYEIVIVSVLRRRLSVLEDRFRELDRIAQAAHLSARKLAGREARNEKQIRQLVDRFGQLELRSSGRPYEQAISLAETGEQADRLVTCFGLAEAEANLISLLHGVRNAQQAAEPVESSRCSS